MTVLTTFSNGGSLKDYRDTFNAILGDVALLKQGAVAPLPTVYFDQPTISASEGNSGTKVLTMTLLRSASVGAIAVTANFVQGSAGAADFAGNALPGNKVFTFADGATSATATVSISGDTDVESDETFGYQLVAPSGYALGSPNSLTGTILNDDSAPTPTVTLSAATSSASESNAGTTLSWVYTVTRSTGTGTASVPWSFAAGTTSANDWNGGSLPTGGIVAFAAGETSKSFSVISAGDTTVEPDESFTVSISAPSGYSAGSSMSATGTIINDDTAPPALAAPTGYYANGATNPTWSAAVASIKAGNATRYRIALVGDSTTTGQGGGTDGSNFLNASTTRPARWIADALTAAGIETAQQVLMPEGGVSNTVGSLEGYNPKVTLGNCTIGGGAAFAGGGYIQFPNANDVLTYATVDANRWAISLFNASGTTYTFEIDGAAPTTGPATLAANGNGGLLFATVGVAMAGAHTLTIRSSNGGVGVNGVVAYAARGGVDICSISCPGVTAENRAGTSGGWVAGDFHAAYAAHLTIINLGLNDMSLSSVSTYSNSMQAIINRAKASGDVLIVFAHPVSNLFAATEKFESYHDAAKALAASNGVPFFSIYEYKSKTYTEALMKDGAHPNRFGYQDFHTGGTAVALQKMAGL